MPVMVPGRVISIITIPGIPGIPGVGIPIGIIGVPVCVASMRVWIASVGAISVGTVAIRPILHASRHRFNCDRAGLALSKALAVGVIWLIRRWG
jgi:hypothetical protein